MNNTDIVSRVFHENTNIKVMFRIIIGNVDDPIGNYKTVCRNN